MVNINAGVVITMKYMDTLSNILVIELVCLVTPVADTLLPSRWSDLSFKLRRRLIISTSSTSIVMNGSRQYHRVVIHPWWWAQYSLETLFGYPQLISSLSASLLLVQCSPLLQNTCRLNKIWMLTRAARTLTAVDRDLMHLCFWGWQTAIYRSIVITAKSHAEQSRAKYKINLWVEQEIPESCRTSVYKQRI